MSGSRPRAGGPSRRRTFAPAEKLQHLAAYEQACRESQGGAYLRRDARGFLNEFVQHYNNNDHHIGIGLHTPADVHYGLAADTDQRRRHTLATARAATPNRFTTNADPKIPDLPEAAWINPPTTQTEAQEQEIVTAAA